MGEMRNAHKIFIGKPEDHTEDQREGRKLTAVGNRDGTCGVEPTGSDIIMMQETLLC